MGARKIPGGRRTLAKVPIHDRRVEDVIAAITSFANREDTYGRARPARTYLNAEGELCVLVETYGS